MNERCDRLSDRMPAVAHEGSRWTADERAHLASCADCAAEWRLFTGAAELGQDAARAVRPEVAAAVVLARLADERSVRRIKHRAWGAAGLVAAAAALVLVVGPAIRPTAGRGAAPAVALPELDSLSGSELERVLGAVETPGPDTWSIDAPALGDLNARELRRVLENSGG